LTTREALAAVLPLLRQHAVVCANGHISRWTCALGDKPSHFYMIGSMGLASSIGLGIALARPSVPVCVLDGDGNLLMNLGSLAMIGALKPASLRHVVLDNGVYASTGNQPTISSRVALEKVALAAGYRRTARVGDAATLVRTLEEQLDEPGPSLLLVVTAVEAGEPAPRVPFTPVEMRDRMRQAIAEGSAG
jgi:thiamine pyrophosphate-dependent acetolactate synthase large subunit-like protein